MTETTLDFPLVMAAGMAFSMNLMLACILGYRTFVGRRHAERFNRAEEAPVASDDLHLFIASLGWKLAALAGLFFLIVARTRHWLEHDGFYTDLVYLLALLFVNATALMLIYAATRHSHGAKYTIVMVATGLIVGTITACIP